MVIYFFNIQISLHALKHLSSQSKQRLGQIWTGSWSFDRLWREDPIQYPIAYRSLLHHFDARYFQFIFLRRNHSLKKQFLSLLHLHTCYFRRYKKYGFTSKPPLFSQGSSTKNGFRYYFSYRKFSSVTTLSVFLYLH